MCWSTLTWPQEVTLKLKLKDKEDLTKSTMRDTGCSSRREQQAPRSGGRRECAVTEARVSVTHRGGQGLKPEGQTRDQTLPDGHDRASGSFPRALGRHGVF